MTGVSTAIRAGLCAALAVQSVSAAQAQADDCMPAKEAEALVLMIMPVAIEEMKKKCAAALPAESYLLRNGSSLAKRFEAPASARQSEAIAGFHWYSGWMFDDMTTAGLTAMMRSHFGDMIADGIESADCGSMDRVLANLDALSPTNFAGALIAIMQIKTAASPSPEGERISGALDMPVCPVSTTP